MPSYIDSEKAKKTIAFVLDKAGTETDPMLEEYHNLFKKEVPLFHRTKAAAYLLMLCDQGKNIRHAMRGNFHEKHHTAQGENFQGNFQGNFPRYPLADEESKRLFFSAGRNRRVFPREILGLINTKTAIPREDIGAIRILDNYSFVQVRDTVAEKIIEALNGQIFRGRPLTVNYAKSRKDGEQSSVEDQGPSEYNDATEDDEYTDTDTELPEDSEQSQDCPEEENI